MKVSDMEDDKDYGMFIDGKGKMVAKGSFFKTLVNHPSVKAAYENEDYTENLSSNIEYKEI
ncbi:hypothetical protein VP193E371_P0209 [Vibrio phage 193E37-1]|nr:hypothetical protein VP193E371_P0209 [Vibrio phage 193E37-1]